MPTYHILGLMSGSSLDGLDIAYCTISNAKGKWSYSLCDAVCLPYSTKWRLRLNNLVMQNAITYLKTDAYFGHYIGEMVQYYLQKNHLEDTIDFISWHGQTIFHQPDNKVTSQIGDGAAIAAITGLPVVCSFRNTDIALGGQGAPIAPIADTMLFNGYSHYLNLGGIANISFVNGKTNVIAYDVCGCNLILNKLAEERNVDYDKDGNLGRAGQMQQEMFEELNTSWYFDKSYPKSLSGGWVSKVILPVFNRFSSSTEDKICTACEHIAYQIGREIEVIYQNEKIEPSVNHKMLITGGGALNSFLVSRIKENTRVPIEIPDQMTIKFKEAILMALMGALRVHNKENCLSSVTGASANTIGGAIFQGSRKLI